MRLVLPIAAAWAIAATALAQAVVPSPKMSQAESLQLFEAGGFKIGQGTAINLCGGASKPKFVFSDLNGDGALEAIVVDKNPACYGGDGLWFTILAKGRDGRWQGIARDTGTLGFETSRTNGWLDVRVTSDCERIWKHAGDGYRRPAACTPRSFAKAEAAGTPAADRAAAMRAAGFVSKGGQWFGGDGNCEAAVEPQNIKDFNGDGRTDIVISESGTFCYGNTGQGFYVMEKGAAGQWRTVFQSPGIPEFQASTGVGGWPDIEIGGPGFCFPVVRYDGKTYVNHRQVEHQPGACARR